MKLYLKLIIIYLLSLLGTFLLLHLMAVVLLNRPMDAPVLVTGIVWMVLFSMIYWGVLIREFKPRLDYILKPGTELPDFKVMVTRTLNVSRNQFSFQKLQENLAQRYEVTYSNRDQRVIKLRDRFSLVSWGACTIIRQQADGGSVVIVSYPLSNRTTKQGSEGRKQNETIAEIIRTMGPSNV